jgi:hypothetical protein
MKQKILHWLMMAMLSLTLVSCTSLGLRMCNDAENETFNEFSPSAANTKYKWFIEKHNAIQKLNADIELFKKKKDTFKEKFIEMNGKPEKWDLATKLMYNKGQENADADYIGIVSLRNNAVKEYNAASEKFTWAPFKTQPDCPPEKLTENVVE